MRLTCSSEYGIVGRALYFNSRFFVRIRPSSHILNIFLLMAIHEKILISSKSCITSEARFDFLKDLVSGVPDLQGDCDELPQTAGGSTTPVVGAQPFSSAFAERLVTATTANKRGHPLTLPRQLSTPKPR